MFPASCGGIPTMDWMRGRCGVPLLLLGMYWRRGGPFCDGNSSLAEPAGLFPSRYN